MTAAIKCERCQALEETKPGQAQVEIGEVTKVEDDGSREFSTASEIDLCRQCSKELTIFLDEFPSGRPRAA